MLERYAYLDSFRADGFDFRNYPKERMKRLIEQMCAGRTMRGDLRDRIYEFTEEGLKARNELVLANTGLILTTIKHLNGNHNFEDLFTYGVIGLINGINAYNPMLVNPDTGHEYELSTFCSISIKRNVLRGMSLEKAGIRLPQHMGTRIRGIIELINRLPEKISHQDLREMIDNMGLNPDDLNYIERIKTPLSLEMSLGPDDDYCLENIIPDKQNIAVEVENKLAKKRLIDLFLQSGLNEREITIILHRIGWWGEPWDFSDLARELGISRERVRQVFNKAIKKLQMKSNPELLELLK